MIPPLRARVTRRIAPDGRLWRGAFSSLAVLTAVGVLAITRPRAALAALIGVMAVPALFWAFDRAVDLLPGRSADRIRPWVYVTPALILLAFFLVYRAVGTIALSLRNEAGEGYVAFANFNALFAESIYRTAIGNSLLWVGFVPLVVVIMGTTIAVLTERVRASVERLAKALILLPQAVSLVGAAVVGVILYAYRPPGFGDQIGLLNGIVAAIGGVPRPWLAEPPLNTVLMMGMLVWVETGFGAIVLSAAVKAIHADLAEGARIDGAGEWQVFRWVTLPAIRSTIVVVWTTVVITTWNVFDIVWVMTGGRDGTTVIAERMVTEFFTYRNSGRGAALATVLLLAVVPIMVINMRRFEDHPHAAE